MKSIFSGGVNTVRVGLRFPGRFGGRKSEVDSDRGFVKLKSKQSNGGVVVVQSKVWKVEKEKKREEKKIDERK